MDISSGTESLIIHLESPNGTGVRFQNYGTHSTTYFDDDSSKKFGVLDRNSIQSTLTVNITYTSEL